MNCTYKGPWKNKANSCTAGNSRGSAERPALGWDELYKRTQFTMVQEVHHRGTEITEIMLNSWIDLRLTSFSVSSVSLWCEFVRNKANLHRRADYAENGCIRGDPRYHFGQ